MRAAFIIFDNLTTLDFVGVYDGLTRLKTMDFDPEFSWEICAVTEEVHDDKGLRMLPTRVGGSLEEFDMVVAPGGFGSRPLLKDESFLAWLGTAAHCKFKASVCTGSLLFGAAGFLTGRRATTHPNAYDALRPYCAEVVRQRIVDEGDLVTAGGVTSGIDLGLFLCEKFAGAEAKAAIKKQMDYPYGD
ncbi:MAG: DJ-1/PfpI family protein [SAR324 cluster bacterium]|nr:DJ-1/PfpI family protein [SAR324 cluster bacterium]